VRGNQRRVGIPEHLKEEDPNLGWGIRARPLEDRVFDCDLKVEQELGTQGENIQAKETA
jgi:hypothetical protein